MEIRHPRPILLGKHPKIKKFEFEPTAKIFMLGHVKIASHTLHEIEVVHIVQRG